MSKHIYFGTCAAAFLCNGRGRKLNEIAFVLIFTHKLSLVMPLAIFQVNLSRTKKVPKPSIGIPIFEQKLYMLTNEFLDIFK